MKARAVYVDIAVAIALLALVFVAWWPAVNAALVYDDIGAVVESPNVRSLWPIWRAADAPVGTPAAGRPVVALSFAANYAMHGLSPAGYHLFSVIVHGLNVMLIFALVRAALQHSISGTLRPAWWNVHVAFAAAVAAIWAIHPLQSDTVIYVSQRTELLLAFFLLLTLWAHARARAAAGRAASFWCVVAVASCALGMACKEVMVVAPVLVWLFDYAYLRDRDVDPASVETASESAENSQPASGVGKRYWIALFATWLVLAAINASNPRGESAGFATEISPWTYLLTQASVIPHYIGQVFAPAGLTIAYDWPLAESLADALPGGAIVLAVLAVGGWLLYRRPRAGFLFAWFFIILAPTSSFVPIATELVAERRMYLPLLAFVAGSAALLIWIAQLAGGSSGQGGAATAHDSSENRRQQLISVGCLALLAIWFATYAFDTPHARARDFQTHERVWQAVLETPIKYNPGRCTAWNNLGSMYLDQGRRDEARAMFQSLMQNCEDDPRGAHYLGLMAAQEGDHDRAIAYYEAGLEHHPNSSPILSDLGAALARTGRLVEAVAAWQRAVDSNPRDAKALSNLGLAYMQTGRAGDGLKLLERAVKAEPGDIGARIAFAQGLYAARKPFEADQQLDAAVGLSGGSIDSLMQTAGVRAQFGDVDGAMADLSAAAQQGSEEAAAALHKLRQANPRKPSS